MHSLSLFLSNPKINHVFRGRAESREKPTAMSSCIVEAAQIIEAFRDAGMIFAHQLFSSETVFRTTKLTPKLKLKQIHLYPFVLIPRCGNC